MSLNKKYFNYYSLVSVSEGLNIELPTSKLILGHYNKEVYQESSHCRCVIEIKKAFTENEFICKMCLKLYKIAMKSTLKYTLFEKTIWNIEFFQNSIDLS